MKVNQNPNLPSAAPVSPRKPANLTAASTPAAATTDFTAATQLAEKLATTPEVRAEQVTRAKALIADPNYPSTATINKVARQLADNIAPATLSE